MRKELTRVEWVKDAIAVMKKQIDKRKQQKQNEKATKTKDYKRD